MIVDIDGLRTYVVHRSGSVVMYRNNFLCEWQVWYSTQQIAAFREYVPALQLFRTLIGSIK